MAACENCEWLKKKLPAEAEWEKTAPASDVRRFPCGNGQPHSKSARFGASFNAFAPADASPDGEKPYGILDMGCNEWPWVSSAYKPYSYNAEDGRENQETGPVGSTRGGGHGSDAL